jgi:hypothetical protein
MSTALESHAELEQRGRGAAASSSRTTQDAPPARAPSVGSRPRISRAPLTPAKKTDTDLEGGSPLTPWDSLQVPRREPEILGLHTSFKVAAAGMATMAAGNLGMGAALSGDSANPGSNSNAVTAALGVALTGSAMLAVGALGMAAEFGNRRGEGKIRRLLRDDTQFAQKVVDTLERAIESVPAERQGEARQHLGRIWQGRPHLILDLCKDDLVKASNAAKRLANDRVLNEMLAAPIAAQVQLTEDNVAAAMEVLGLIGYKSMTDDDDLLVLSDSQYQKAAALLNKLQQTLGPVSPSAAFWLRATGDQATPLDDGATSAWPERCRLAADVLNTIGVPRSTYRAALQKIADRPGDEI